MHRNPEDTNFIGRKREGICSGRVINLYENGNLTGEKTWMNDAAGSASGSQAGAYAMKCVAEEVKLPIEERVEESTAPKTFDAGIVAAVAAILSATGYALSKKR